jgi:hypothetical protein
MPTERIGSWLDWWSIAHAVLLYRGQLQDNGRPAVMLHLLGFGNRIAEHEFNQLEPYLSRLNRLPFWHIIQTGEKSWRQIR